MITTISNPEPVVTPYDHSLILKTTLRGTGASSISGYYNDCHSKYHLSFYMPNLSMGAVRGKLKSAIGTLPFTFGRHDLKRVTSDSSLLERYSVTLHYEGGERE